MRGANEDRTGIVPHVVDTKRDRDAKRIRKEIVVIDRDGFFLPTSSWVFEIADHLALFGIDTDDRIAGIFKLTLHLRNVLELDVSVEPLSRLAVLGTQLFMIDSQQYRGQT